MFILKVTRTARFYYCCRKKKKKNHAFPNGNPAKQVDTNTAHEKPTKSSTEKICLELFIPFFFFFFFGNVQVKCLDMKKKKMLRLSKYISRF